MNAFIDLFRALDETTKTNDKLRALVDFFEVADDADKVWAVALLSGKRPKKIVRSADLRQWCADVADVPLWLLEESYHIVGDLAETLARLSPPPKQISSSLLSDWMTQIIALQDQPLEVRKAFILNAWDGLDEFGRFVFNKILMGGFRIGVSQRLMTRALSQYANVDVSLMAHRLMGKWDPVNTTWQSLIKPNDDMADLSRPYPFCLAYPLESSPEELGVFQRFRIEWKWDGIRAQLIRRNKEVFIWSRGEELSTDQFPEIVAAAHELGLEGVWDGEILVFRDGEVQSFGDLQKRLGRKKVGAKIMQTHPVVFRAYDVMEHNGDDVRSKPLRERVQILSESLPKEGLIHLSEPPKVDSWEEAKALREMSRAHRAEGFMVKPLDAPYEGGRKRGIWWKWKVDPLTIDAVMIYAMRGHGRRANLYTDYTFAVKDGDGLVPVCKAYSGLTDEEIREVDRFVKANTQERFGPVRSVSPELVFEIAFEGIRLSSRHKSGVAMRFPRISRWRKDKPVEEIDTLNDVKALIDEG
ncbi:MAG: ATP-dependent DNA ligase [Cryomorphaceae bacterium]|nr:ATP-dependent DNA ligase [Cryomorphaceae bacterium]